MSEYSYDEETFIQLLDDVTHEKRVHQLNEWELSFVSTCYQMTDKHIMLSQKQRDILNKLWERVTKNG